MRKPLETVAHRYLTPTHQASQVWHLSTHIGESGRRQNSSHRAWNQLIRNKDQLVRNGGSSSNKAARRTILHALESALQAVNPSQCLLSKVQVQQKRLSVDGFSVSLTRFKKITLLAVGKASGLMMRTSIELFKDLELRGILVAPKGWKIPSFDKRIEVFKAGHPSPNRDGLEASKRVMEAATKLRENDLLVCLISGGASALLPSPAGDISLQDKKRLTEQLIRSRVSIHEINTVRRHLSNLKGGRLVQLCRSSTILSLLISDVPGNHLPDIASGLTVEDPTTYSDAIEILRLHRLWDTIPKNVRNHLIKGFHGEISETPKPSDPDFRRVHNVIIADNRAACLAAKEAMKALGVSATILTSSAEMESHSMGRLLASIVSETKMHAEHMSRSSGIILGGETNLERIGKGIGGRNQETILSAVELIGGLRGVAIAAFGTDGVDGNSKAAGAIIDGNTAQRARRKLMEPKEYLARNDSNRFFRRLNDSLITGPTGTNVGDLYLMVSR